MPKRLGAGFAAAALIALLAASPNAAASRTFMRGFADGIFENVPSQLNANLGRATAVGAQFILIPVVWGNVSPAPPARGTGSNPANPEYNWGTLDATVRAATARGLTVAFTVAGGGGPPWADGPHRPSWAQPGTWRPNAAAFGAFMKAVALRYSGSFNPGGGVLPRVRFYQAWSEPNLYDHITPQWVYVHHGWVAESAIIYRSLLNAAYSAVKSVHSSNVVITGGTAPFGDVPALGNDRVPPATFVRTLLCLSGSLRPLRCPNPAHFDILAHHPYEIGGPWSPALDTDDVSLPDIGKLTRPLHAAERTGRALPRGHKQVWVTEFSYDSSPPDPQAVPMGIWAHYVEESFYVLWSQGVDAIAWFLLQDQPCVPNCALTYQSGMYFDNGRPKPLGVTAYRFPFVVEHPSRGRAIVWGISPASGRVRVQVFRSHRWRTLLTFRVRADGIFTRTLHMSSRPRMRAVIGSQASLTWG